MSNGAYSVQVGSFSKKDPAERKCRTLLADGFRAYVISSRNSWRVQVGTYTERAAAIRMMHDLREAGYSGYITSYSGAADAKPATSVSYRVQIRGTLRARKGPGTEYPSAGFIQPGVHTIVAEASGTGSSRGWGKLSTGVGWISLDFCSKMQ